MSHQDDGPAHSRLRLAIGNVAYKVRRQVSRFDNAEIRKGRTLARKARNDSLDVLLFGDSLTSFTAPYDSDRRPFHRMLKDAFDPSLSFHAVHGGSFNPLLLNQYVRLLEAGRARPLVVLPLTVRVRTLPWMEHPAYGHRQASDFLASLDPSAPLRRIRKGLPVPPPEEWDRFYELPFPTWAGDLTIGEYVRPLRGRLLSEDLDDARLLYAYHHGGQILPGEPLDAMQELGERLRRLDVPVVAYQTPVPVEKGVELHGPGFRELAERNHALLEEAFLAGYGEAPVVRSGVSIPTRDFIDWRDGSEHVNQQGRLFIVDQVAEAARSLGVSIKL